ncbi:MAG TPA: hypothetical protein VFV95_08345 [Vicinamibacterales bacterium]|nr:hypothetical protein [Vicinamibacterales bacterium]
MSVASILALVTASVLVLSDTPAAAQVKVEEIVPEARPVLMWLDAVKIGDLDRFKTAFSERMRQQFEKQGWATVLMTYQDNFRQAFGDYRLEDFVFQFTGGADSGYVSIVHQGKKLPALSVVKEKNEWKVNER